MSKYLETASELAKGLHMLFRNLTLGRFLKWIISLLLIGGIIFFVFESFFSSSYYYDRIDRKIEIIEKVQAISGGDSLIAVRTNEELMEVLKELDKPKTKLIDLSDVNITVTQAFTEGLIKFLSAIFIPLIIMYSSRKDPDYGDIVIGAIAFIVVFGTIAVFIPTIRSVWINFLIIPVVQIIGLAVLAVFQRKQQNHSETP